MSAQDSVRSDSSQWPRRQVVSFGRRDGRRQGQYARTPDPSLSRYVVGAEAGERGASLDPSWRFDAAEAFGRVAPLVVEIGSGTGEATLAYAASHPELDHLAVEVYRPGASRTVIRAGAAGLTNVRVLESDGRALLATGLAPASVAALHVYFPDPWPKKRHHKRRLVDAGLTADVARVLAPGGVLRLATDWQHYSEQMLEVCSACPDLTNPYQAEGGWAPRFAGRPETLFERKGVAAGRIIRDLEFRTLS